MLMAISSAVVLAMLASGEAAALVKSECITPRGINRGLVEFLPDADAERRRPCRGHQTEVLTQVVDVFPTQRAIQLGLVPNGAAPELIEGTTTQETVVMVSWPQHPVSDGDTIVSLDIFDINSVGDLPHGCAMWFLGGGVYTGNNPAFLNLNSVPQFFSFVDHFSDGPQLGDYHAALIVGPAPDGEAREMVGPIRFALPDGTIFRFDEARVAYNAMGETGCHGSTRVTIE